ncbi:hypothetical protein B0H14DRAFT_2374040, partial [Mycena olivaceomarginata]
IGQTKETTENARVLLMQMVNSLTSKLQIGSPMTSLYLLNNPGHYKKPQIQGILVEIFQVKKDWLTPEVSDGKPIESAALETDEDKDQEDETDQVVLLTTREGFICCILRNLLFRHVDKILKIKPVFFLKNAAGLELIQRLGKRGLGLGLVFKLVHSCGSYRRRCRGKNARFLPAVRNGFCQARSAIRIASS